MNMAHRTLVSGAIVSLLALAACGDNNFSDVPPQTAGTGGSAGETPDAAPGDETGVGGTAGAGGATGGAAGEGGSGANAGMGGDGGGTGGDAGTAGIGGTGGDGGTAGAGGSAPDDAGTGGTDTDGGACLPQTEDCDNDPSNGCETATDTTDNCGACGTSCAAAANASPVCQNAACGLVCETGFGDCDTDGTTGCETPTDTVSNCGACGNECPDPANASAKCDNGTQCGFTCDSGFLDCDTTAASGCEIDSRTDLSNCGSCGHPCATGLANATSTCAAGQCGIACTTTFGNCNNQTPDGCEVNLATSVSNCGACGTACPTRANSTPSCAASACKITCTTGYANCDTVDTNGCEIDTKTDVNNCGGCTKKCGTANATPSCAAGVCALTCSTNFADCNTTNADGCEVNLKTDAHNCGACGHDCGTGTCNNGYCTAWMLAEETTYPKRIAVGSTHVYWTLQNAVRRVSKSGGVAATVAPNQSYALAIATDDTSVFWGSDADGGSVHKTPVGGGIVTTLATSQGLVNGIALDANNVYWSTSTQVKKIPKTGGTIVVMGADTPSAGELATDATHLYWVTDANPGKVQRVSLTGIISVSTLASGIDRPVGLDVRGDDVYLVAITGALQTVKRNGTGLTTLLNSLQSPIGVVSDGTSLFFTESAGGTVKELSTSGGTPVTRWSAAETPYQIRQDATKVYWNAVGSRRIYVMVK